MPTVFDVYKKVEEYAPIQLKEDFDNVGLLVGEGSTSVSRVLISLDVTAEVAQEATRRGAQLIIAHHPVFFHLQSVTDQDPTGKLLIYLLRNGISVVSMHTNLDKVSGGVNDMLAQALGLQEIDLLCREGTDRFDRPFGLGRVGFVAPTSMKDFVVTVAEKLGCGGIRYADAGLPVHKVAVGGGTCGDRIPQAVAMGCDTFVTADMKYNMFLSARDNRINLIDAGHYPTENVICPRLKEVVSEAFPGLEVLLSKNHQEAIHYWSR